MSINRVIISGNLTRDPELRSTASGLPVLGFGVAVNDRRKNQQTGEWEDYPNFIDCTMFGARAESLSRFLSKGTKVAIEGKLRWSQWEREGQKRSKIEVIADELEFMSGRDGGAGPELCASDGVYDEETRAATMKRVETAIAAGEGAIDNVDEWGKRKLAYEINGLTDGDYTLIDFHAKPENIAELDRVLRITDAIVRHMIVKRTDRD